MFILYLSHDKPSFMSTTCSIIVIYLSINYQKCTHMLYLFSHIFARIFFLSPSTCRNFFSSPIPCMNFFLDLTPPLPGYLMVRPLIVNMTLAPFARTHNRFYKPSPHIKGQHELLLAQATKLEVLTSSKPSIGNQLKIFLTDANN